MPWKYRPFGRGPTTQHNTTPLGNLVTMVANYVSLRHGARSSKVQVEATAPSKSSEVVERHVQSDRGATGEYQHSDILLIDGSEIR